jgi:hypothetical protein
MNITDTTQPRFELGIQMFLEGQSVVYHEVLFWMDGVKVLHINSYSDWNIENTTQEMAKEKISRSKSILAALSEKSPEFSEVANRLPHEYYFCFDYGQGAVALAKEVNSAFTWMHHENYG